MIYASASLSSWAHYIYKMVADGPEYEYENLLETLESGIESSLNFIENISIFASSNLSIYRHTSAMGTAHDIVSNMGHLNKCKEELYRLNEEYDQDSNVMTSSSKRIVTRQNHYTSAQEYVHNYPSIYTYDTMTQKWRKRSKVYDRCYKS